MQTEKREENREKKGEERKRSWWHFKLTNPVCLQHLKYKTILDRHRTSTQKIAAIVWP